MKIKEFPKYAIGVIVLLVVTTVRLVESQNLSKYYGNSCDFQSTVKNSSAHVKECNTDLQETTERFLYVVLVCIYGICQCPDVFFINGKVLNATGYEWNKDRAQCLLSANSECGGLTENMCADGPCVDGRCYKVNDTDTNMENKAFGLVGIKSFPSFNFSFLQLGLIINLTI